MSHRCTYCDYSEDSPSLYRESLALPNMRTKVTLDTKTGNPTCSQCAYEINNDLLGVDYGDMS